MENVLRSGPFTSVNGDRAYMSSFFADYFASFIGDGVFPNPSDGLQVISTGGLSLTCRKGRAWIGGRAHLADDDIAITLDPGDNLLARIDKVVLRLDTINRTITKEVKKGVPATNPVAPALQRDNDIYELGLATIAVARASTSVSQSSVTDLRLNSNECGLVKGTVEKIDTTTLFSQYQAWIAEKKVEYESDFNTWLQGIKDVLDGDVAGNILNKIDAIPLILSGSTEPMNIRTGDTWLKEV